jgi:transposase-like protein
MMSSGSGSNLICRRMCAASSGWTTAAYDDLLSFCAVQTCIVHLIRHSMDFASWKDRKSLVQALRTVYRAADAAAGQAALDAFA